MEKPMQEVIQDPAIINALAAKYDINTAPVYTHCQYSLHDSPDGLQALHQYDGNYSEIWLAYSIFKTIEGNDVLKTVTWLPALDNAPFTKIGQQLYYLTTWEKEFEELPRETSMLEQAIFLAKWHYLCREIIKAQNFADSLSVPASIRVTLLDGLNKIYDIAQKQQLGRAISIMTLLKEYVLSLPEIQRPHKALTLTLPTLNTEHLAHINETVIFLPFGQRFLWGWQLFDLALLLRRFANQSEDQYYKALQAYCKLNSLQDEELKWLSMVILVPPRLLSGINIKVKDLKLSMNEMMANYHIYKKSCAAIGRILGEDIPILEVETFLGGSDMKNEPDADYNEVKDCAEEKMVSKEDLQVIEGQSEFEDLVQTEESVEEIAETTNIQGNEKECLEQEEAFDEIEEQDVTENPEGEIEYEVNPDDLSDETDTTVKEEDDQGKCEAENQTIEEDEKLRAYREKYKTLLTWSAFPEPLKPKE